MKPYLKLAYYLFTFNGNSHKLSFNSTCEVEYQMNDKHINAPHRHEMYVFTRSLLNSQCLNHHTLLAGLAASIHPIHQKRCFAFLATLTRCSAAALLCFALVLCELSCLASLSLSKVTGKVNLLFFAPVCCSATLFLSGLVWSSIINREDKNYIKCIYIYWAFFYVVCMSILLYAHSFKCSIFLF